MTETLTVSAGERGGVRVFDVALDGAEAQAFAQDPAALARALGVGAVNMRYVDVFPVDRLAGLALTDYLAEGHGIPPDALDDHALALNGLTGHVAVIASGAFGGVATTLDVTPPLRHVATLQEARAEVTFGDLPSGGARPAAAPAPEPSPAPRDGRAYKPHRIVAVAILVVFVLAIVLFGGFS